MDAVLEPDIYHGRKPWQLDLYTPRQAAHYVGMPMATAYSWLESEAKLLQLTPDSTRLNFMNLVELYVLNSLRRHHKIPLSLKDPQVCELSSRKTET